MTKNKEKFDLKSILPSKKFVKIIGLCLGLCALIIILGTIFKSQSSFSRNKVAVSSGETIGDLLVQDSNNNGIPDWEESLYGLNPKGDGVMNKKIIDDKKSSIQQQNGYTAPDPNATTTQNSQFTSELMSTILALQQSGNLNAEQMQNIDNSLGATVDAKRDNLERYSLSDMNIYNNTNGDTITLDYLKSFNDYLQQAKTAGIGTEMALIQSGLTPGQEDQMKDLEPVANAYIDFGKNLISIKTPNNISTKVLDLANSSDAIGHSLKRIENMYSDSVGGMVGFDEYSTSTDKFNQNLLDISDYFNPISQ